MMFPCWEFGALLNNAARNPNFVRLSTGRRLGIKTGFVRFTNKPKAQFHIGCLVVNTSPVVGLKIKYPSPLCGSCTVMVFRSALTLNTNCCASRNTPWLGVMVPENPLNVIPVIVATLFAISTCMESYLSFGVICPKTEG